MFYFSFLQICNTAFRYFFTNIIFEKPADLAEYQKKPKTLPNEI
jgi:hypothetical protein